MTMKAKPTYEELERRVQELENKLVMTDIAERKRSKEVRAKSEERFRIAKESCLDSFLIFLAERDSQGQIIDFIFSDMNTNAEQMLQMPRKHLLGRRMCEELPINRANGFFEKYKAVVETGIPLEEEFYIPDSHVPASWCYHQVVRLEDGIAIFHRDITERKKTEEELANTLAATTDGIWTWNFKTGELSFSQGFYTMLGYEPFEFPASYEAWVSLIYNEDLKRAVGVAEEYLKTKPDVYENEFRMKTRNGSYRWIHAKARVVRWDKDGYAEYMIGNHEDITERRLAEESLVDHKRRLEHIIQGTNVGTWEWNVQTGETIFNQRWAEIIGYVIDEIAPITIDTWMKFCHPEDLKESERLLKDCFEGRSEYYQCECRMKHKDGSWIWVLDRGKVATWTDDGKPEWMYGTHQAITERKRAEAALKESEELYRKLLSTMPDLLIQTNLNGDIIFVSDYAHPNPKFIANETLLGKNMLSFIAEKDQLRALENTKLMFDHVLGPREYQLLLVDGTFMDAEVNGDVIHDAENNPKGMVYVIRDIAERKKMEKQLLLVEKGESLSRMAGAVAHHFNNILMITIGNLEMIQGDIPQGSETADSIEAAVQAAHRAVALSRLMLTYLGQGVIKNEKIDLSELCRMTMNDLSKKMPENIHLTTRFEFAGLIVQSDRNHLEQVLNILFENAVEALAEKTSGSISVTLAPAETSDIQYVHVFPNNWHVGPEAYARLVFSDTGKGMAEKTIHLIFDPFYSDKFTGRGLGLAVALGIVKAHGGCICVQSQPGQGTDFIIFLPLSTTSETGSTEN